VIDFVHLHVHSHFSPLDGLGKPHEIVKKAKEQGSSAIAITDHASISCFPDFQKACSEHDVSLILGCEFYVVDRVAPPEKGEPKENRYHLTVWAKSWQGVKSIMKQLSLANHQFYYRPRLSFEQILDFEDCFIGTACCFGVLSHDHYGGVYQSLIEKYKGDLFLEIMPHVVKLDDESDVDSQAIVNHRAIELKAKYGGNLLLTNDAHYVNRSDAEIHRNLLCAQYRKKIQDFSGWGDAFYMRSFEEMVKAALEIKLSPSQIEEGVKNTSLIASQCHIEKPKFQVTLPSIYESDNDAFTQIIVDGWNEKINGVIDNIGPYFDRMTHEIKIIKEMDFIRYFLIVHDVVTWARGRGIQIGPGRGSAGGSLVCYLMEITQVDPIRFGLYFERFLNPARISMPDIDIDFQDSRRHEVFEYVSEKYGKDKTAFVNTFSVLSGKSAFRDVCRSHGIDSFQVNNLSKQIDDSESFDSVPELISFKERHPEIVSISEKLDGTIRQVGRHACAQIVSSHPLNEVCALERRKDGDREVFVTNWDKRQSESFGLLKMDFLGLSTLTLFSHAKELIRKRTGTYIDFVKIPLDDDKTLKLFQRGETVGVFQFEGDSMRGLLKSICPDDFMEVALATALYRPGSLESGQTERYVKISKGEVEESYLTEELRLILKETKGVMVYQEQIIQIFNVLGGFTLAESDQMRKIIGKKLGEDEFEAHREHFINGCIDNGIDEKIADQIFTDMVKFSGYGFNKSHSVEYTMISWWAAYLKVHYPIEFMAAALSISGSDTNTANLILEAKRLDIKILPPDINTSGNMYGVDRDDNIRYPLSAIKGVGKKAVSVILDDRESNGPFNDFDDFKDRVPKRQCNKRVAEALVRAGAFESLGVIEGDSKIRIKNFFELISGYAEIPSIELKEDSARVKECVDFVEQYEACSSEIGKSCVIPSIFENYSGVMIINGFTKKQRSVTGGKHNAELFSILKKNGIKENQIYYTSPFKCASTRKKCQSKCPEMLKKEIEIAKPKLIICFAIDAIPVFEKGGKMANLNGKFLYNSEFDCYVLFSYSPQYAFYKSGDVEEKFIKIMEMAGKMIGE